jgi:DNA-directed RNA polymerase subunit omega
MARITIEDCLKVVENRFNMVLLASERARKLMRGSVDPLVPQEHDKPTVIALREIAGGFLTQETRAPQAKPVTEEESNPQD